MPGVFRNNLVFANNKRQNIEYRLFATGSAQLRTGSLAIAYSSFFNKFISDLPTQNNQINTNYYASESKASNLTINLTYQNTRSIYLQTFDIFVQEFSSTASLNETSSNSLILYTNYYASESKASNLTINLIYQNTRSIYLQNQDIFVQEFSSTSSLNETSSNSLILYTNYYASESVANVASDNLTYQNSRSLYLENSDIFIREN